MKDKAPGATPDAGTPAAPAKPTTGNPGESPRTVDEVRVRALRDLNGGGGTDETPKAGNPNDTSGDQADGGQSVHSQVEAGSQSDPQSDPNAEADQTGERDEDGEGDQRWPKSAVDRLQRRTQQRDRWKSKAEELQAELDSLKGGEPKKEAGADRSAPAASDSSFDSEFDSSKIERRAGEARNAIAQVNDLLDDLHDDPDRVANVLQSAGFKLEEFTVPAMRQLLRSIRTKEQSVAEAAPKRMQFLRDEEREIKRAVEIMPDLVKQDSEDSKLVRKVLGDYPELRRRPDWAYHAAIYVMGFKQLQAKSGGSSAPKSAPKAPAEVAEAPKVPGAPRRPPAPANADAARIETLRQKAMGPKSTEDDRVAYTRALLSQG